MLMEVTPIHDDGTLIFVPALTQVAQLDFCARCERQLGKLAAQLRKEGFRKAEYRGGGRYAVIFEGVRAKGEPLSFFSRETPGLASHHNSTVPLRSEPSIRTLFHSADSRVRRKDKWRSQRGSRYWRQGSQTQRAD